MNCYFCQRQAAATPAVALCQGCGAGCCLEHVAERVHPGRGPGLQPMQAPRVEILCLRCLALQASLFPGVQHKAARSASAASPLAAKAGKTLPSAQEAVCAVEELLGFQSSPAAPERSAGGWRRFFHRWRSR